jgi:CheY-like chemotaxis protein
MSQSETTSFSVLVVEDDADIRDSLAEVLDEDGFAVLTASNGREAFEVLQSASAKPSVILLDMMMPVMDGWEFRKAQRNDPELASIPVAVFSARPNIEAAARSVEAAAYFRKPLSIDHLIDTLDSLCLQGSES